jgi:hypothetical protein
MNTLTRFRNMIILLLLSVVLLVSCVGIDRSGQKVYADEFSYRIVEIEGMTCIWYNDAAGYQGYAGLTCNWDEWQQ